MEMTPTVGEGRRPLARRVLPGGRIAAGHAPAALGWCLGHVAGDEHAGSASLVGKQGAHHVLYGVQLLQRSLAIRAHSTCPVRLGVAFAQFEDALTQLRRCLPPCR